MNNSKKQIDEAYDHLNKLIIDQRDSLQLTGSASAKWEFSLRIGDLLNSFNNIRNLKVSDCAIEFLECDLHRMLRLLNNVKRNFAILTPYHVVQEQFLVVISELTNTVNNILNRFSDPFTLNQETMNSLISLVPILRLYLPALERLVEYDRRSPKVQKNPIYSYGDQRKSKCSQDNGASFAACGKLQATPWKKSLLRMKCGVTIQTVLWEPLKQPFIERTVFLLSQQFQYFYSEEMAM